MTAKRKTIIPMLILCFVVGLAAQAFSQHHHKNLVPPDILPVIFISGTDADMGFQYGYQAAHYIERNVIETWASALEQFSRDQVHLALKANQHYILEYTPRWIDFMKGMVKGAEKAGVSLKYEDILLLNCTLPKPESSHLPAGAKNQVLPPKSCSVCSAWGSATKDGRLIGLDTLDGGGEAIYGVIIAAFPDEGNHYICGASAGEIGDHFLMNNKGLFLGNSGGGSSPRDIDYDYGLCWSCSLPYIARFATSAKAAKDMIMKWKINVPENFHFVDVNGGAYVVEKTSAIQEVRKPGDFGEKDFLYSTNNYHCKTMAIANKGDFVKQHGGYGDYASPRCSMLWDMLHNYHGQVDVDFMKMILRFPGNPPPMPPKEGWNAKICRPSNNWVSVSQPDDGNKGIVSICTGPAGRVIHSSMASDGSTMRANYQYVHGTHTFFQLQLAESPKAVVNAAKKAAKNRIADAYAEFMHLNPTDIGFKTLEAIYAKANAEYYQGCHAYNLARLAEGNDAITKMSKAVTAFARSQAHAAQVVDALIPPPTSPSDLGLKPFGGDWAQWETETGR